jgi:hypothetical protein
MADEGTFITGTEAPSKQVSPIIIVKGGSTPASYDKEIHELEADAEKRRDEQDEARKLCSKPVEEGGGQLYNKWFGHPKDDPKVLIKMVNSKGETEYEMLCELVVEELATSMSLIFVCPDCVERGIPQGQAQVRVNDKHRKFFLDDRTKGQPIMFDGEVYVSAGLITDSETLRCSNFQCGFKCKIHKGCMKRES